MSLIRQWFKERYQFFNILVLLYTRALLGIIDRYSKENKNFKYDILLEEGVCS